MVTLKTTSCIVNSSYWEKTKSWGGQAVHWPGHPAVRATTVTLECADATNLKQWHHHYYYCPKPLTHNISLHRVLLKCVWNWSLNTWRNTKTQYMEICTLRRGRIIILSWTVKRWCNVETKTVYRMASLYFPQNKHCRKRQDHGRDVFSLQNSF